MTKDHGDSTDDPGTTHHAESEGGGKHVVLVGCGAIGSAVVPHLGRMRDISAVTLVDRDTYEARNLTGQEILPRDVGQPKAIVQARRLRRIRPEVRVEAIVGSVENVPFGVLRSDVVVAGLDSRLARQIVNDRCFFLGIPWIDGAIEAEGSLAQVTVYVPGDGRGCLLCGWSPRDFELVEQSHPCPIAGGPQASPAATNAPSSLAALAASLLSIECDRLIHAHQGTRGEGFSILIDAAHHQSYATRVLYNDRCPMPWHDAAPARVKGECPPTASLVTLFEKRAAKSGRKTRARSIRGAAGRLRVVGQSFATAVTCPSCSNRRELLRLRASLDNHPAATCERCERAMVPTGFDTTDEIDLSTLPHDTLRRSIGGIGVRPGDIVRVTPAGGEVFDVEIRGRGRRTGRRKR